MKYKVLLDCGSEGMKLQEKEYSDINAAFKDTIAMNLGVMFLIVTIVCEVRECVELEED